METDRVISDILCSTTFRAGESLVTNCQIPMAVCRAVDGLAVWSDHVSGSEL